MKRLTKRSLVAAAAIALTAAAAVLVVLLAATTQGSRWLLTSITSFSGVSFSAQTIEGRIADHLLLSGVRVGLAQQKLEFDSIELRWKPLLLLAGTVALQELVINGVRIQDDAPPDNKAPVLAWPKMPAAAELFDARIARLQVTNISYRRRQEPPLLVTAVSSSVSWQDGTLSGSNLQAVSPAGQLAGSVSAGFSRPSLTADLAVALLTPLAKMDQFSLQARQSHDPGPEPFVGTVRIIGSAGREKLLELSGEVGMARNALNLRRLHLTRPGQKGLLTAAGSLAFTARESALTLQVKAAGLDLAPELSVPADLSGELRFTGTLDSYRGDFTLVNQAQGWQAATIAASYQGTSEGVKLSLLTGRLIDGTLSGNLAMNWQDGFTLQGVISGRNLNPARIDPTWQGVANFNIDCKLAKAGGSPLTGNVSGALLESRLHGQALTGRLQADLRGKELFIHRLLLQGKGFDLQAAGELNRRLELSAQISDLALLVPGAAGKLQAEGWLRWQGGQFSGELSAAGNRLAYNGARTAAANLHVRLEQGPGYPLHAAGSLRDVIYDGYRLNAVTVAADGTLPRHTLNATLRSAGSEARLNLNGGYNAGIWKGEITKLAGRDSKGPWNLAAPAAFVVSAAKFSLSPLSLTAAGAERLEVAADLALKPLSGQFRAEWTGIELTRLKPWLPRDIGVEGRLSGRVNGSMLPGQRFELDGNALLSGGTLHRSSPDGELKLNFKAAKASWGWRGETLSGIVSLTTAAQGQASAEFKLPIAAHFPLAVNQKGPLQAAVSGRLQEKGVVSTLFPGLVQESFGQLDTAVDISGSWEQPLVAGKLTLARAGAYLPTAGIHLKDLQLEARLEKNLIRIDSFRGVSGAGHIEGTALLTLAGRRVIGYQGTIRGENFQTIFFPELQVLTTPKLSFEGTPQKLILRGELQLPELRFVGAPSRKAIAPSSDVIREGRVVSAAKSSSLVLDAQIRLLLGEKVFVKVAGIDAQLGGAIDLTFSRLDRITSRGEVKVVKGRYRTYGVNLEIVRGRLFFAGSTIDRPSLDFLALRTIGNVRAGVTVAGTLQKPVTRLYSEPAMPDVDVLAYIVLGHPLGSSGEQASLVAQAAGALLTSSQATVLQEKIKSRFGLSTLEIQDGVGGTASHMGYKPLQVTPPGAVPAAQQPGITDTILTVGKYLTPQIYISYGKSLFTGSNLFRLRYDISKKWQIETQTGDESGADLFYKFEFDR